jgi:hypothetical protein
MKLGALYTVLYVATAVGTSNPTEPQNTVIPIVIRRRQNPLQLSS